MPPNENEAWQMLRAAILRCQADPSDKNMAEMRRCSRLLRAAWGLIPDDDARDAA
jgi:hypothetical protein